MKHAAKKKKNREEKKHAAHKRMRYPIEKCPKQDHSKTTHLKSLETKKTHGSPIQSPQLI